MKKIASTLAFAATLAAAAAATGEAHAQIALRPVIMPPTIHRTDFKPEVHGFKFANTFVNDAIPALDVRTSGLCGGMVYSTLDYYYARVTIPQQDYEPAEGSRLRDAIYARQVDSLTRNLDKWAELKVNPFGSRNDEFWRWGVQGTGGGRLAELRAAIDAGRPAPLGLLGCNEGCKGDHQVLAIGYDAGRYRGDLGANMTDLKIFVYDPNFPGRTMTLRVDPQAKKYYYDEDRASNWRTYMVDAKYSRATPPSVPLPPRELLLTLRTGGDDLRGGNDNVNAVVLLAGGRELRFDNVNRGRRWINDSERTVSVELPAGTAWASVKGVRLETTFGGGIGGDNWNLDRITVERRDGSGRATLMTRAGAPLVRFTGDRKRETFAF